MYSGVSLDALAARHGLEPRARRNTVQEAMIPRILTPSIKHEIESICKISKARIRWLSSSPCSCASSLRTNQIECENPDDDEEEDEDEERTRLTPGETKGRARCLIR